MMGSQHMSPTVEGFAFVARGSCPPTLQENHQPRKGRPWCDHCARPDHTRDAYWKLHNKLVDWRTKSTQDKESRLNSAIAI